MRTGATFIFLWLTSLLAIAQQEEPTRQLSATYYPQPLEQALISLVASNIVSASQQVEYQAGGSIVLTPGFEARSGAVFTAHTGYTNTEFSEGNDGKLAITTYPNPFVDRATITYNLARPTNASLFITTADGKVVGQLVENQLQSAGRHQVEWQPGQLPTGSYVCILQAGTQRISSHIIRK